jgi:hypothetical protein
MPPKTADAEEFSAQMPKSSIKTNEEGNANHLNIANDGMQIALHILTNAKDNYY